MSDNRRMICNVCKMPVSALRMRGTGEVVEWVHLERQPSKPHDPVPVPEIEVDYDNIDQVCDFCSAPEVEWVFETERTERLVNGMVVQDTAWGACQPCTDYLNEHPNTSTKEFIDFVMTRLPQHSQNVTPEIRAMAHLIFHDLYQMFLDHRTGEVVRVRDYFEA